MKKDYQALSSELEKILAWFESDKVNLDEAIVKYEQALELIKQIETYLKSAENRIKKVNQKFNPK